MVLAERLGAHSVFSTGSIIDAAIMRHMRGVGYGPLAQMTSTFCHELAEMCTDSYPLSGWAVPGGPPACSEIGDFCNGLSKVVEVASICNHTGRTTTMPALFPPLGLFV